jgi:hypothetical protein
MKAKLFLLSIFSIFIYAACEDDVIDAIGMGIQPEQDIINVYDTIININSAYTVKVDSIYTVSVNGLLGNFYDSDYGDIKAGYLCQYYPSLGFADTVAFNADGSLIDSVRLALYYTSYFGDSLAPMEVSVYPIIKPLNENYYTNIRPEDYCNKSQLWGKKAYTAVDLTVSDSIRSLSTYYKNVSIPLPVSWGETLYKEYVKRKASAPSAANFAKIFGSLDEFVEFFPGTYLESSFGTGNLLQVDISEIYLYYKRLTKKVNSIEDSTYTSSAVLTVTKEVIQLNNIKSSHSEKLLDPDPEKMYLKTPAGVFSKIIIPVPEIVKGIGKRKFNSVSLKINAYPQPEKKYALPLPGMGVLSSSYSSKLLLIEPDSVNTFFEAKKRANSETAFTTIYDASTQSYNFNNIANLIQSAMEKAPEKALELLLIPVQVEYITQSNGYSSYSQDYSTAHYLFPSAATLKKGGNNLQIKIIASDTK